MMMDFNDDFDFIDNDTKYNNSIADDQNDIFDFSLLHSTPSLSRPKQPARPIDFPSIENHYGILTFFDQQLPIIYRLINDTVYIPYIRFSYVLNIFEHPSYNKYLVNIRNLPVIEMTQTERIYYNQLSSLNDDSDWSHYQLLSVSILDGTLAVIDLTQYFNNNKDPSSSDRYKEWQDALNVVREEARDRWRLEEKTVLTRLTKYKETGSRCISSTSIAKRRSFFEQRLDLSIVDEVGGFVQIDSYIYPFIKNVLDNRLYINLADIRQNYFSPPSFMISYINQSSPMYRSYSIVSEQAQSNYEWNAIHRGRNNDLSKVLPSIKWMEGNLCEELPFISLTTFLHLFLKKNSNLNLQFVQLFETASLDEIESNYKTNVARQFIMTTKRQGGLVNGTIPCLISSQFDRQIIWIPSEMKTRRMMTNDERLFLNIILLYYGLWQNVLTKKKQWYLTESDNDKENLNVEILSEK